MISWMQKHKRYLVVTIWISTIAFVGAGFVGWGAYSFSDSEKLVAKVEDREIKFNDLQQEYSKIYSFYSQLFGDNFNQEFAKNLRLEEVAVKNLIENAIWSQLAEDFGLVVLDEEVTNEIISMDSFKKDGVFDKDMYVSILSSNRIKAKDFEQSVRENLLIQKLKNALSLDVVEFERELLADSLSIEDNISIYTLYSKDLDMNYTIDDMKSFWEGNRDNYKSKVSYDIDMLHLKLDDINLSESEIKEYYNANKDNFKDDNGTILSIDMAIDDVTKEAKFKALKKEALKRYLDIKKSDSISNKITLTENNIDFGSEFLQSIAILKSGDAFKPIEVEDGYITGKLLHIEPSKNLDFEEAKELLRDDFLTKYQNERLNSKAKELLGSFEGDNIGFISKDNTSNLTMLEPQEVSELLDNIYSSKNDRGFVTLGDKAILFKIESQKFADGNNTIDSLSENIGKIKETILYQNALKLLEKKYKINLYYKGN